MHTARCDLIVYDPATGTTTNLGIAGFGLVALDGGGLGFRAVEQSQRADLNGHGDLVYRPGCSGASVNGAGAAEAPSLPFGNRELFHAPS